MKPHHTFTPRLAALALACVCASAQADTLKGTLERGPAHSVLWTVSPESGDLIGQVFANASQAGQTILAHCLPGLHCVAEGASTAEPPETLAGQLSFSAQPSGWWLITQAHGARMQPSLPMSERQLHTRYGQLAITDEYLLLFNGRPVLANPPHPTMPAAPASPPPSAAPRTLLERINVWWQSWRGQLGPLRGKLLALLGHTPAPPTAAAQAEPVQGNAALHIVAHFELEGQDIVLLQDTGGTACPALYRFATLTAQDIAVTPEFGTCSDLATATLQETPNGAQEPLVTIVSALGPADPGQEAHLRLRHFALQQGQVQERQVQR